MSYKLDRILTKKLKARLEIYFLIVNLVYLIISLFLLVRA